jgi:hypothetical protein
MLKEYCRDFGLVGNDVDFGDFKLISQKSANFD